MMPIILFILSAVLAVIHCYCRRNLHFSKISELLFRYVLFFNVGVYSLFSAYGHVFMGPQIANEISWPAGSPFQFEIGIANLSYGVLGILSLWLRDRFWQATVFGWSIFLLGAFVGHMIQAYTTGNKAPYNFGIFVWFNDLFLPVLMLSLLSLVRAHRKK